MKSLPKFNRRAFTLGVSGVLFSALAGSSVLSATGRGVFSYSRSGNFYVDGFYPLLLGGLIIDKAIEDDLEQELEDAAAVIPFNLALEYGTGRLHRTYLEAALQVLANHETLLFGATLNAVGWNAEVDTYAIWRREAEARFLQTIGGYTPLELSCVRHLRGEDDRIYKHLEKELGLEKTRLHPSMRRCPRILQVSSAILKCLGALAFTRQPGSERLDMIEIVKRHYGIDDANLTAWDTPNLKVKPMTLEFK